MAPQISAALVPVCGVLALTNRDESQASEAKSGRSLCASESRTDAEAEELLNEALVAILRKNAERRGRTDAQQEKEAVGGAWAAQCKGVHLRSVWLRKEAQWVLTASECRASPCPSGVQHDLLCPAHGCN